MDDKIKNILNILEDLYAIDPALREKEAELIKLLTTLVGTKPDTGFDESFSSKLRNQLLTHISTMQQDAPVKTETPEKQNFFAQLPVFFKLHYKPVLAAGVLMAALIVAIILNPFGGQSPFIPVVSAGEGYVSVNLPVRFEYAVSDATLENIKAQFKIEPEIEGTLNYDGKYVTFEHEKNLKYETDYKITISDFELPFSTRPRGEKRTLNLDSSSHFQVYPLNYYDYDYEVFLTPDVPGDYVFKTYESSDEKLLERYNAPQEYDPQGRLIKKPAGIGTEIASQAFPLGASDQNVFYPRITTPGIYYVEARNSGTGSTYTFFLVLSKHAVTTKRLGDKLITWVVNQKTSAGVEGAKIESLAPEKTNYAGQTNAAGLFEKEIGQEQSETKPKVLSVTTSDDQTLNFIDNQWRWSVYWNDSTAKIEKYKAHVYTDRPLYKPGDVVNFKAIIRESGKEFYKPVKSDFEVRVVDAGFGQDAKTIFEKTISTNDQGSLAASFDLSPEVKTGSYQIEIEKDGVVAGTSGFNVEFYQKPDFDVQITTDKDEYIAGQPVKAEISSEYFFGGAVKGGRVNLTTYTYDGAIGESKEAALNSSGKLAVEITAPAKPGWWYWGNYEFYFTIDAEVVDPSGKASSANKTITVYPSEYQMEITKPENLWNFQTNTNYEFDLQLTEALSQNPKSGVPVHISFQKYTWENYNQTQGIIKETDLVSDVRGLVEFELAFGSGGNYHLTATSKDSLGNDVTQQFYFWVSENGIDGIKQNKKDFDTQIIFSQDKKSYAIGETAEVSLQLPRPAGQILWSANKETFRKIGTAKIDGYTHKLQIPVTDDLAPGFYLYTEVFHDDMFVESKQYIEVTGKKLEVKVTANRSQAQPGEDITLKVETRDENGRAVSAEASVSVIDKALLALRSDMGLEIYEDFYPKARDLMQTMGSLTVISLTGAEFGGGGGGGDSWARSNFKDSAYWNANVLTNNDGIAEVTFKVPDNVTTWVAMVKTVTTDTKVGQGLGEFLVTKPLIIQPVLPQFTRNGDKLTITAGIHNNLEKSGNFKALLKVQGATITDDSIKTVNVSEGSSKNVAWQIGIGAEKNLKLNFSVEQEGGPAKDGVELNLPVYSNLSLSKTVLSAVNAKEITINIPSGASKTYSTASLTLTPSVLATFPEIIEKLSGYPYGCVEQTMSKHLPNILIAKEKDLLKITPKENLNDLLADGYQRLANFRHSSGGFGWWETDADDPWITGYVFEGLVEAKQAGLLQGFEWMYDETLRYIKTQTGNSTLSEDARIYLTYVVTRAESGYNKSEIESLANDILNAKALDIQSQGYIALAVKNNGNHDLAKRVMDKILENLKTDHWELTENFNDWHGSMRDKYSATGVNLLALMKIDPGHNAKQQIVQWLMNNRNGYDGLWGSTRQSMQILFALIEYLKTTDELKPNFTYQILLNGELLKKDTITDGKTAIKLDIPFDKLLAKNTLEVKKDGAGNAYWTFVAKHYVPSAAVAQASQNLRISREYVDLKGNRLKSFRVGDLVKVRLIVSNTANSKYVMIEDFLPAGLEAQNPRLENVNGQAKTPDYSLGEWFDSQDIRDERVSLFRTDLWTGNHTFEYVARASYGGEFEAPSPRVELMYSPEDAAYGSSSKISVR